MAGRDFFIVAGVAVFAVLGGCDNGPSAVATRDRSPEVADVAVISNAANPDALTARALPEPTVLTANRRETVDAKILRLYERNGADFGARSPEDFVARVEAFTKNPPAGVEKVSRPNGDTLLYQASTNTFAVVARDGTARTMFKPDDGPTYWAEQKERAPTFGQRQVTADN
ncbi:S-type pyocin family protein [Brevundimonas variabilis]|uniref:Pyocin large subunit-like protein n=1 Tax=Brevundimonas variabilis TaxID=74312 RepID=A0A7W9CKZ2_9CAUL|nr:S-type pyocin family protein [Brevundimonas variabilis]MBB5747306.1 pyocin large subunit-like protein [Brevundimonas variabilis]